MTTTVLTRRDMLIASARGAAALGAASLAGSCSKTQVDERSSRHQFKLGLDTYTVHRSLTAKNPELRADLWSLLEQLEGLELDGLQIDSSHFPGDDVPTLERLREAVEPRGYYIEFGMGGWDVRRMKERMAMTAAFGGRAVRTFCGSERTTPDELELYTKLAVPAFREAAAFADKYKVAIAVENHGDFTSAQLKDLLDQVGHPRVGACLDTGNSMFRREDPLECARTLAPYALSMHLKDWTMSFDDNGEPHWKEAVIGEGAVPVAAILEIVAARKPDLYIALENPVSPGDDEKETVQREWRHLKASAAAARRILRAL